MLLEQSRYQIRFDWGSDGAAAVSDGADVVVWVDAIADDSTPGRPGNVAATVSYVLAAQLQSARAVALWIVDLQKRLGKPVVIAVIAAGAFRSHGGYRFAMEDELAAGAVIAELGSLGLDATSPEAAVAEAAFRGLERAGSHLLSASVTSQALASPVAAGAARVNGELSTEDVIVLSAPV